MLLLCKAKAFSDRKKNPFVEVWLQSEGDRVVVFHYFPGTENERGAEEVFIPWKALVRTNHKSVHHPPRCLRWYICSQSAAESVCLSNDTAPVDPAKVSEEEWSQLDLANWPSGDQYLWNQVDHLVRGETGWIPRRVSWELLRSMNDHERTVARMGIGMELQFFTEGVEQIALRFRVLGDDGFPLTFALMSGDQKQHPTRFAESREGREQSIVWHCPKRLEEGRSEFTGRLLFPMHGEIELITIEGVGGELRAPAKPFRAGCPRWLVHGDSITHGANVTSPDFTWVEQVARRLHLDPVNFGLGGNARAQSCVAEEIARRKDWDFLSLHMGANSFSVPAREYEELYMDFLDIIRREHPGKPIVCVTPLIHSSDSAAAGPPTGTDPSTAEQMRRTIRRIVEKRGDAQLFLVEGRELLNSHDGLLVDGTHPSDHGAAEIARNLGRELLNLPIPFLHLPASASGWNQASK